ncbi:MAG: T9SS type A sorting domain-containing protein, partial [Ignavibacteriae bacterium]|nr:T9SS type A sorting domain-containing protein [Ignavibacteriota bacterium]
STFIGNEGWQDAFTMDIDKDDNVYVAGRTTEGGILTTPDAFDSTFNGGENGDEFFVKYDPTGSVLLYGTYIGGFADDWCRTLIVDSTGDVYVVGRSPSSDFPTTPGAFDETYSGSYDVTITKLHLGSSVGSIEGLVFYDRNGNGQMDSSEYALQNWPLRLADTLNQQLQIVMTNTDGYFRFKVEAGSYKVSQIFNNDWEQSYPPARLNPQAILYDVNVNPGDSITGLNFGAHPLGDEPELDVYMYAGYPYPLREPCCGDSITYFIVYRNIGNVAVSNAKIEVTLDEQVLYSSVSSDPDIGAPRIDGKKIQWNNISLNAQSGNRKIVLYCKLDCVQPPSPQPGPQVISKVEIKPHGNDFKHKRTANCSHDPNDKRVQPAGCTAAGFISPADSLTYTIRFQNTGTAPAYRVIVRDTLDGDFDFSTVKPLGSSHASVFQRFGNELVWTFDPIELPDSSTDELGSQGFLTFQVKPPVGVPDGTVFENRAGIYFDRNAVVMTNTTVNTVTSSPLPVASFVVSAETVLAGSPVNFFYNGGNTGATYHWEFGYGAVQATSAEENPTGIIYLEEGEQLVSLNVGLGDCISEPAVQSIVVVAPHYATDRTMVNFGQTSGGTTKTDTVIITNDGTATLYIQSVTSTNTQFSVQSYPDSVLSQGDGMFILAFSPTDSGSQSGNIILVHSAATSPDTVEVLGIGTTTTVTFNYNARWNIVSNPLASPNDSVQYLFPNAINNRAFRFDGNSSGYISSMRLEQGRGYWAKFATGGTLQAIGLSSEQESVSVTSNWNLLGSLSEPLPVSKLTGLGTSLASLCYGYNAGYYVLDTILPGSGFWAKMSDSGTILLSNSSSQMNKTLVQRMSLVSKLNTLTIENSRHERQTLYFGMNPDDKSMVNENYFELPPSLEDDMFDVRFQTNTFAVFGEENSEREVPLVIHSQESPVTISWSVFKQRMNVSLLIDGKQQKLTASGKVTIQSGSSVRLQFSSTNESIPEVFALHQAFPNPFNPTTSIAFDLPENALVSVKIFDVLGREVAILANTESYEAGSHKLAFDGSGLPSGLYFYRISAQGEKNTFADVKRMLMVK